MGSRNPQERLITGQIDDIPPHEQVVYFATGAEMSRQEKSPEAEATYRYGLGAAYHAEQRYDEAIESWLESLKLFEALHDEPAQARTLDHLGTTSDIMSNLDLSQTYYLRGLRLTSAAGLTELSDMISGHLLTTLSYEQQAGHDRPARSYVELANFATEYGFRKIAAAAGMILGRIVPTRDDQDSWSSYGNSARSISELNDRALHYMIADQSLRAIRIFQRMIRDWPVDEDRRRLNTVIYSVGDAYREIGLWEDAATHLLWALSGYQAMGQPWMEARIAYYLASIYRELHDTESTARYARLGIDAARVAGQWETENRAALAAALFDTDRPRGACAELVQCLSMADSAAHPSRYHGEQADQLMKEIASTWDIGVRADPDEMAAELGRYLSARNASGAPEAGPDDLFPDPATALLLRRLATILSTPETGEERWHWDHQQQATM
jgi:tetratricopeptide (TPR) repeat protein